ncbi:MAG TPA: S1C family serine protease [Elusimicrobiota bacterium]|nr:S1C family serine protease [Elusimicrobiota bacterium]
MMTRMGRVARVAAAAAWAWGAAGPSVSWGDEFAASLSGLQQAIRASAANMGVGAFTAAPGEVQAPVPGGRRADREDRRNNRIYEMAARSTLIISAGNAVGSGFIVDPSGLVMTNAHVISGDPAHVTVTLPDGTQRPATVMAAAPGRDIAILRIDGARRDWPALPFGDSARMVPGFRVYAMGNPTNLGISFAQGMISRPNQDRFTPWLDHIQSDLQIHPGNSGGPLLDNRGRVVGMNSMITGMGGRLAVSIGANDLQTALSEFRRDGALVDGDLGATLASVPDGPPFVTAVGGARAREAGMRIGDTPLKVGGDDVTATGSDASRGVRRAFARKRPGETVEVQVRRSIAATVVLHGTTPGAADTTAAVHIINASGVAYLPPAASNRPILMAASFGQEIKIKVGEDEYPAELLQAANTGMAILKIKEDSGWTGTFQTDNLKVRVERYAMDLTRPSSEE